MSKAATAIAVRKLRKVCYDLGVTLFEFNHNSFRLKKHGFVTLDVYPKSMKTFNHDDKMWGEMTNIENFVKYQFR